MRIFPSTAPSAPLEPVEALSNIIRLMAATRWFFLLAGTICFAWAAIQGFLLDSGRPSFLLLQALPFSVIGPVLVWLLTSRGEVVVRESLVEIKRSQQALQDSEATTRAIVDTAPIGMITMDEHGVIQSFNPHAEEIFGYQRDEIIGKNVSLLIQEEERPRHKHHEDRSDSKVERATEVSEAVRLRKDGTEFPVELAGRAFQIGDRRLHIGISRDISQRKQAEAQPHLQATAMNASIDGISITDADGNFQYVNDAKALMHGYEAPEDLLGKSWRCLYTEDQLQWIDRELIPRGNQIPSWRGEILGKRADGSTFPKEVSINKIEGGGTVVIDRDISQRKQTEAQLRLQAAAMGASTDGFFISNEDRAVLYVNDAKAKMHGYPSAGQLKGESWRCFYPDDEIERIEREFVPEFRRVGSWRGEAMGRRLDGSTFPKELNMNKIEGGGTVVIDRDISDRKAAEDELVKQKELLQTILDHMPVMLTFSDGEGRIQLINKDLENTYGF